MNNGYINRAVVMERTVKRNSIWNKVTNASGQGLEEIINDIPAADVVPIRHGRWNSGACSKCGSIKPMTKIEDCGLLIWEAPYKLNYCPNCGAKMDGESDEID